MFELARDRRPYDEEFLLAALLHDVGKGLDPHDHVEAGLSALDGLITERTRFFIAHHMDALALKQKRHCRWTVARSWRPRRISRTFCCFVISTRQDEFLVSRSAPSTRRLIFYAS